MEKHYLDILPGSGNGKKNFGNQNYLQLVKDNLEAYNNATKKDKGLFAALVVAAVQETGGKFLIGDGNGGFVEMTNREAKLKTMKCFNSVNHKNKVDAKKAAAGTVSEGTNATAVAEVVSNPGITPGAAMKTPNECTKQAVRVTLPALERGVKKVAVADSQDTNMPDAAGMKAANGAEFTTSIMNSIKDGFDTDLLDYADSFESYCDSKDAEYMLTVLNQPEDEADPACDRSLQEDIDVATKSVCDRTAMTSVLSAVNFNFDQQVDLSKIKFVPRLKIKDDRTYMGSVMENIPHGRGVMTYKDGRVVSGDWVQGVLHGQATIYYKGNGSYFGTFSGNKRVGCGVRHYADGSIYVGQYVDDKPNLKGVLTKADGSSVNGDFKDGMLEGIATKTSSDGKNITTGIYKNGKLDKEFSLKIRKRWNSDDARLLNTSTKRRKTLPTVSETKPE